MPTARRIWIRAVIANEHLGASFRRVADHRVQVPALVEVPAGRQCPYYLKSEGVEDGVYVRVGATTRHADLEWTCALAQAFLYMGLIEDWGSGIPRVMSE